LDEPESKASLIWILGDYAEKIDNADEILATFLDTFVDDPFPVESIPFPSFFLCLGLDEMTDLTVTLDGILVSYSGVYVCRFSCKR
jgi:hypothetical protein